MHFLHIHWVWSGNIFNRTVSLLNVASWGTVGEKKKRKCFPCNSSKLILRGERWETQASVHARKQSSCVNREQTQCKSIRGTICVSEERKSSSPFQIPNSSLGRIIRNSTLLKREAKQRATRRQMIGCQDFFKTRWSSHRACRLSQVPAGIERARSEKQGKNWVVKQRS